MREMKDSGVEWIGKIPKDWEVIKNKYVLSEMYSGATPTSTNADFYSDNGIPFVSIADMSANEYVENTQKKLTEKGIRDKNLKILSSGTVLYSIYATVGAISELKIDGTISQAMIALNINKKIDKRFYKYNLKAMKDYIKIYTNGNTQFNLNAQKVWNFYLSYPSINEQEKIANYLDDKCAKIDIIIEKQQAIIEKLEAYLISAINEIIVDVDGISAHLGFISTMKNGLNFNLVPQGNKIKFLGVGDFKQHFILDNEDMFSDIMIEEEIEEDYFLKNGDIIFVRSNGSKDLVGRAIMVENVDYPLTYSGFCIRLRNRRHDILNDKYLLYFFRSPYFRKQLEKYSQGSNINNINQVLLSQIQIIIPSMKVQLDALNRVESISKKINEILSKKQATIDKFIEYKKSLIYEVVTGKKEI